MQQNSKIKTVLFVPTYNVAGTVAEVLRRIPSEALEKLDSIYLVDNGSHDGTREIITDIVAQDKKGKYRCFLNESNYSLGGSTIIAFREAIKQQADYLICMHSDGQADPMDLTKFLNAIREDQPDFVFGNRMAEENKEYSKLRLWGNKFFAMLQRILVNRPIQDIGSFIAFKLDTVEKLKYWQYRHDMGYHPLLILEAFRKLNPKWIDIPIKWGKVEETNINPFVYGIQHLWRISRLFFNRPPITQHNIHHFRSSEYGR